jgi:hypothetical protein
MSIPDDWTELTELGRTIGIPNSILSKNAID